MSKRHLRKTMICFGGMAAAGAMMLSSCSAPDSFSMADTDDDERISPAEFKVFMMDAIFAEVDADADSSATLAEWKTANPSGDPAKFKAADTNRNSALSPAEAKASLEKSGALTDLFRKMDTNRDGFLSHEEIVAFKKKLEAQSGSTTLEKLSNISKQ